MAIRNLPHIISTCIFALCVSTSAYATTIWNGPMITFTKPDGADWTQATNQDRITNDVWLTRQNNQGLYNIAQESSYNWTSSPANTEWAFGTTSNWNTLTYNTWGDAIGYYPPGMVGQDMVVHLITDDIYADVTFLSWSVGGSGGQGGFSYERSTEAYSQLYQVIVDTTSLFGQTAQLALDFTDGGSPNNLVKITDFSTDGNLDAITSTGTVTGSLPGEVTFSDINSSFFNEQLAEITLGNIISFSFQSTANGPDWVSNPDAFSLFLLDPATNLPLFATLDPTGADSLFRFDIDGTNAGSLTPYAPYQLNGNQLSLSVPQTQVPSPSALALLVIGCFSGWVTNGCRPPFRHTKPSKL